MDVRRSLPGGARSRRRRVLAPSIVLCLSFAVCAGSALAGESGPGLAGVTMDSSGGTLSGVEIRVAPLGRSVGALPLHRALSDEQGRFALAALAPGAYRLVAVKGGYAVVVGQVDTVVQNTVRLVLRPTAGAAPGTAPADNSWTLRLPRRDVLEDVDAGPIPASATTFRFAPAATGSDDLALSFEGLGLVLDGAGAKGGGAAMLGARYESEGGRMAGFVSHRREDGGDTYSDAGTGLRVRWVPESGTPGRTFEIQIDALRRDSEAGTVPGPGEEQGFGGTRWAMRDSRESPGWSRDLATEIVFAKVSASGEPVQQNVLRLAGSATVGRTWHPRHLMSAGLDFAAVRGARRDGAPNEAVLLPGEIATATPFLQDALGDRVSFFLGDLWQVLPALTIATRTRAEWSRGYDGELRAVPSLEARYTAVPGVVLRAEGGLVLGGARAGSPVGRVEVSGGGRTLTVTAAVDRVVGSGLKGESATAVPERLAFGPDARVDRIVVDISARPRAGLPEVRLSAERLDVDGDIAARLPHDVALIPLAPTARAAANRVELAFGLIRSGSSLLLAWEELDQEAGAPVLPEAAGGWERTAVSLRQRVLARDGLAAFLVLGAESTRLAGEGGSPAELRALLLERRRLSGGVSVTF